MCEGVEYLHSSVQKGYTVQQRLPHGQVADAQLVLGNPCKGSLQTSTYSLWWVVGKLDRGLGVKRHHSLCKSQSTYKII